MEGYCMKCRAKKTMKAVKNMTKKGRRYAMGKCSKCGTNMARILGKA